MRYWKLLVTKRFLANRLASRHTVTALFAALGVVLAFDHLASISETVRDFRTTYSTLYIVAVVTVCLLYAVFVRRPKLSVQEKIADRDIHIRIMVGDIMQMDEPCVIGTNTTFDTDVDTGLISAKSLQGQLTAKYYDTAEHLDADIQRSLSDVRPVCRLSSADRHRRQDQYPVGQVARIKARGRKMYLLAMAHMNASGSAETNFAMISDALNALWQFFERGGVYESEILIPVLGTGAGRVTEKREEIVREIIASFVVASRQKRVCNVLSIVIYESDFYQLFGDLDDLHDYLRWQCQYSGMRQTPGVGVPEGEDADSVHHGN